ncbi:MAG: response regulator [Dehalococcoidales bacterium]|jgi:two-component system chemotaxis response regulator CheY
MLKTRILLADRSTLKRTLLARALRRLGFDVIAVARDGKEAVLKYARYTPDITLIDFKLGELKGIEVIRALKSHNPAAVVGLMMPQNMVDPDLICEAAMAGARTYSKNPAFGEEIKKSLYGLLEIGNLLKPVSAAG